MKNLIYCILHILFTLENWDSFHLNQTNPIQPLKIKTSIHDYFFYENHLKLLLTFHPEYRALINQRSPYLNQHLKTSFDSAQSDFFLQERIAILILLLSDYDVKHESNSLYTQFLIENHLSSLKEIEELKDSNLLYQ